MSKDPAFLFYSNDFLTGTYTMTDEQVGKYIRLLSLQHQKGHLTKKDMLKICGSYDEDVFAKFEQIDGNYINRRMADETEKRRRYSESRANNRKRHENDKKDMKNISKTYVQHMENENINEYINKVNEFKDFWDKYHKLTRLPKTDREPAKKWWDKLSDEEKNIAVAGIDNYVAIKKSITRSDGKPYFHKARTYLSDKLWQDEQQIVTSVPYPNILSFEEQVKLGVV